MDNEIKVRFGIDAISEELYKESKQFPESITPSKLELRNLVESIIIRNNEKIRVRTGVSYSAEGQSLCELVVCTTFYIKPFTEVVTIDDTRKTVSFKAEVISTLLNNAFGILRGVLYEKTKGTPLASFPLPLIPIRELEAMNRFKLEDE